MRAGVRSGPLEIPRPFVRIHAGGRGGRGPGTQPGNPGRSGRLAGRAPGRRPHAGAAASTHTRSFATVARTGLRRGPSPLPAHEQRRVVRLRDHRIDRDPRPHREQRPLRRRGGAHGRSRQLVDPGLLAPGRSGRHGPGPHGNAALLRRSRSAGRGRDLGRTGPRRRPWSRPRRLAGAATAGHPVAEDGPGQRRADGPPAVLSEKRRPGHRAPRFLLERALSPERSAPRRSPERRRLRQPHPRRPP